MRKQIIETLRYFKQYNQPITKNQLYSFLPIKSTYNCFEKNVKLCIYRKQIMSKDDFLASDKKVFNDFQQKRRLADIFFTLADSYICIISKFWFIRGVAISGSLSMKSAVIEDDIDFFIICSKNTAWIVRFYALIMARLFLFFKGYKKTLFCLNLFFEEHRLQVTKKRQNLQSAREILQVLPVLDKNKIFKKFYAENTYVFEYFPNGQNVIKLDKNFVKTDRNFDYWYLLFAVLNKAVSIPQKFWLKFKGYKVEEDDGQIWLC